MRFMCENHDVKHRRAKEEQDGEEKCRECSVSLENRAFFPHSMIYRDELK